MSEFHRQHPVAALAKVMEIIRNNFITILIILFIGGGGEEANLTLYWFVGLIVLLLIWGVLSWYRFQFKVEEGELRIEQGVLVRKKLYMTSDRIQVIDISAGIIQRLFGLVAVEVKTAGSTSKEATISAVTREQADELKYQLRRNGEAETGTSKASEEELTRYYLTRRDLLVAATTSGRFGVALSLVGAAFSQVDQLFSEDQIIRFIENSIPASTSSVVIVSSIIAIIVISWLISFGSTFLTYYNFTVEVHEEELLISRGLFERTQLTIPFNRIQAVQIKEGILRQPFGYASLVIESAGYGESEGNSTMLFPLIAKKRMLAFINEVIPDYHTDIQLQGKGLSRRALRRYLLRMTWLTLGIIAVAWSIIPYGIYSLFLLLPAWLLGYQQFKDAAIASSNRTVKLRFRMLSKTTAILKKYRVQAVQVKQNPFQKRLGLSNVIFHVASGNQGRSFTVRELTRESANRYWMWVTHRGNDNLVSGEETA